MVPLAPKLKVITYHFISYRRKSVLNLVEIQNTFIRSFVTLTFVLYQGTFVLIKCYEGVIFKPCFEGVYLY